MKNNKLPNIHGHIVFLSGIHAAKVKHLVKIFIQIKGRALCIFIPTGHLCCADDAHFSYSHFVKQACSGNHRVNVFSVHVGLCHDAEAVFYAKCDRAECILLCPLAVSEPIVMTETVKRDLHEGITSDLLHFIQYFLCNIISVGVQLLHVHATAVDPLHNGQKAFVTHRLPARNGKGVDSARLRLVE